MSGPALRFALLSCTAVFLTSCGGSAPSVKVTAAAVTSNWQFLFLDPISGSGSPLQGLSGALTIQGTVLSATFHSTGCVLPATDITFTGSIDPNNNVTLTSTNLPRNTAVITGTFTSAARDSMAGGLVITGTGPCAYAQGISARGRQCSPLSGTYTATLTSAAAASDTGTATLTQGAPNPDGFFPETGTLTFGTSSCSNTYALSGLLAGPTLNATLTSAAGTTTNAALSITVGTPAATEAAVNVTIPGAGCGAGSFTGTLNAQ